MECRLEDLSEMETLVSKFHLEWRGLFAALDHGIESDHRVELWLTETHRSQYGDMAGWSSFVTSLCEDEPYSLGTKLSYCPRLLAFPLNLQRNILGFIHRYRERFPMDALMQLIDTVQSKQISDEWVTTLLRMIQQHCKCPKGEKETMDVDTNEEDKPDIKISEPVYTFSPASQSGLKELFLTLQSMHPSFVQTSVVPESDIKIKQEQDYDKQDESVSMDVDVDESFTEMKPFTQSQSRNISFTRSQLRSNFDTSLINQRSRFLEPHMQTMFDTVKEFWYRQQKASSEDLQLFALCSQDQIAEVCTKLELNEAPEGVLSTACEQFISLAQNVSYSSAVCFARTCILPSVLKLEESATRTLTSTLMIYAKTFPKQTVDGILVPCSIHAETNTSHADLLSKVLKESFVEEYKQYYVEVYLKQGSPLKEAIVPVLQQLLDARVPLNEGSITGLVDTFELSSLEMSGNLKFSKLLLAVINKYSKQLTANHVNSLKQTVQSNKTFLKKSCFAALNKLKT